MSAALRMLSIGLTFLNNKPTDRAPGKVTPSVGLLKGDEPRSGRSVPPVVLGQGEYRQEWPSQLERAMASGGLLADGPCCPSCGAPMDYSPETCIETKRGAVRFPPMWVCNCGACRDL